MSRETDGAPTEASLDEPESDAVAAAEERIADAEDEFGPDAPPRGASPGNPRAEESPR